MLQAIGLQEHAGEVLEEGFAADVAGARDFTPALRNRQAGQSKLCCGGQDIRSDEGTSAIKRQPDVLQALGLCNRQEKLRMRVFAACVAGAREFERSTHRLRASNSRNCCRR